MERALRIAYGRMGMTSPNPPVGTVIVRDGAVIATGGTGPCGTNHAEVCALEAAGAGAKGAELYVSLEPCSHFGKTPPCTGAIIRAGIARVFIPALDPNPLVSGKGVSELKDAGIDVIFMHDMAGFAADLIRQFKKYILRHRPFVISKSAVTLDGRTATPTGDSRWISSEYSRYIIHRLRAKVDAVIVGKNTLLRDNPSLNVRFDSFSDPVREYFNDSAPAMIGRENYFLRELLSQDIADFRMPLRVLVGLPDAPDLTANFFADDNYMVFETAARLDCLTRSGALRGSAVSLRLVPVEAETPAEGAAAVVKELHSHGIMFALLEGGGTLAGSFLDAGEIDQFLYVIAPKIAGNGLSPVAGSGAALISESLHLRDVSVFPVKDDIFYNGYREQYNFEMM